MLKKLSVKPEQCPGEYFVWNGQGHAVSVHLNLSIVNPLDSQAREALGTLPSHALEVGGLLLGRVRNPNQDQYIVSIERFEPFEIEHLRGPSYILSAEDRDRLFQRIRKFGKTKNGLSVVGFYRSHTRPGLYLDDYDFRLLSGYFAHPSSVALLVRPVYDGPATAGFFIWEDGEIHRARTYREFSLSVDLLRPRQPMERPDASAPMISPLPVTEAISPEPAAVVIGPEANTRGAVRNPFFIWTAVAGAALIASAALWQPRNPTDTNTHNALSLNAEPSQSGLRLTWNRTSPLIAEHPRATLSITDGTEEKQIVLDATQLKTGAVIYWPTSSDVNFRLQLGSFSESLRAISPPLAAQPAAESAHVETPSVVEAAHVARPPMVEAAQPTPMLASVPPQTPKPVAARLRKRQVRPAMLPADGGRPVIQAPELAPPPPMEIAEIPAKLDRPIITERHVARPAILADIEPVRGSGFKKVVGTLFGKGRDKDDFVPPRALRQVNPDLPGSVKPPADTRVSVKVSLDETGRVRGADLVTRNVETRLANAAMDAAKRWRFQPARQQDKPVGSSVILHFRFHGEDNGS